MKKIVITGGHLTPAQAVISELHKRGGWKIYYFGRKYATEGEKTFSAETRIIPQLGVDFIAISTGRLQRQFSRHTISSLLRVPLGFLQSFYWLWKIKPEVICSFGGYVSVPAVISGWLLRIPILTHEQTITFGLSSKINSRFANKIAVSFPDSVKHFAKNKVVLTGNPIRKEIFKVNKTDFSEHYQDNKQPCLYITGGNQGSQLINNAVIGAWKELAKKYLIILQCGAANYEKVSREIKEFNKNAKDIYTHTGNYLLLAYTEPEEIGWVMNRADLIISRAGANTVCELAALGKPALLIPIPWTYQDEQTKNAQMLVGVGIAEILPQKNLTAENLYSQIDKMMNNIKKYESHGKEAGKLVRLEAASRIVELLNELTKDRTPK